MARLKVSAVRNGGSLLESSPTCSGIGGAVDLGRDAERASARVRCSRHARALAAEVPLAPRARTLAWCGWANLRVGPFSKPALTSSAKFQQARDADAASRARVGRCTPRGAGRDAVDLATERESDPRRVWRSRGHGERGRGGDEPGHEAEESPSHEGAMRARGEASIEMQGVQRLSAREEALSVQGVRRCMNLRARSSALKSGARSAVGLKSASTVVSALYVQGVRWVSNLRARSPSVVGLESASTVVGALGARSAAREHGRRRSVVHQSASTVVSALRARSAVGLRICEHGRERSTCKECGGCSICEHGRERSRCKDCGGGSICEHSRRRSTCKECGAPRGCDDTRCCSLRSARSRHPALPTRIRVARLPSRLSPSPRVSDGRPREHLAQRRTRSFAPERKLGAPHASGGPYLRVALSQTENAREKIKKRAVPVPPAHEPWCPRARLAAVPVIRRESRGSGGSVIWIWRRFGDVLATFWRRFGDVLRRFRWGRTSVQPRRSTSLVLPLFALSYPGTLTLAGGGMPMLLSTVEFGARLALNALFPQHEHIAIPSVFGTCRRADVCRPCRRASTWRLATTAGVGPRVASRAPGRSCIVTVSSLRRRHRSCATPPVASRRRRRTFDLVPRVRPPPLPPSRPRSSSSTTRAGGGDGAGSSRGSPSSPRAPEPRAPCPRALQGSSSRLRVPGRAYRGGGSAASSSRVDAGADLGDDPDRLDMVASLTLVPT